MCCRASQGFAAFSLTDWARFDTVSLIERTESANKFKGIEGNEAG